MENSNEIDINNSKIVEKNSQNLAEKFAQSVVKKNVFAKLLNGTKINGVEQNPGMGCYDYGPDKMLGRESDDNKFELVIGVVSDLKREIPELINTHMLSIHPNKNNEKNKIVTYRFFQDKKVDVRGYTDAKIQYEFSNEDATKFVEEVSKNPDLLEEFYQKTFNGLDSTSEHPGIRRVRADGFYLISESDIKETNKIINSSYFFQKNEVKEFFNNLKKYHYKNGPYGSGEPFNPSP